MKIKGFKDTIEWYNQNASSYQRASDAAVSINEIDQLEAFSKLLPKGSKILDAGCGSGRDTATLVKKGFNVTGLDVSSGLIEVARKTYPDSLFIEANFLAIPFDDSTFDAIWAHNSILHLETVSDVKKALREFSRVLKIDGILHVLVKAQMAGKKTAVVKDKVSKHDRFFQYFSKEELEKLLKGANFNIIFSEQYNETRNNPKGRAEIDWIVALCRKI